MIAVSSQVVISLISLMLGTALVQAQSAANQTESACVLKAGPVDEPNGGATDYSLFLHPIGTLRGVMIFVDFPDAEYRETTNDLYDLLVPYSQKWLNEVSYGRMSLQVTPVPKWYRMSKPSIEYGFTSKKPPMTFEQHRAYIAEAIHLAEADVSFKDYQFVTVVAAVGSQIPPSPAFHARTGQGILTEGIEVRHAITFGADIRRVIPNFGAKILCTRWDTCWDCQTYTTTTRRDQYRLCSGGLQAAGAR